MESPRSRFGKRGDIFGSYSDGEDPFSIRGGGQDAKYLAISESI